MFTLKKLILEAEDDFNVTPGGEWNITYLGPGDTIIGKMWDWKKIINMINNQHGDDHVAINRDIELWKQIYDEGVTIRSIETAGDYPWIYFSGNLINWGPGVGSINNLLNSKYQVTDNDLRENEDEFNVTPGREWNITYLKTGDTITSDMWKDDSKRSPIYILGFEWDQRNEELSVVLEILYTDYPTQYWNIDVVNKLLKPKYQVTDDNNLTESEDDFNVTPDEEWGKMTVGDTIAPHMWNLNYIDRLNYIDSNNKIDDKTINWHIEGIDSVENVILTSGNGKTVLIWIDILNKKYLKPEHQVYNPNSINESEDEFDVTPGEQWNQIELTMGDTITPDMWEDKTNISIADVPVQIVGWGNEDEDEDENEPGAYVYIMLNTPDGYTYDVDLDILNDVLKPEFRVTIDKDLRENKDEFNVTPGKQWNTDHVELEAGDIITPDMWNLESDEVYDLIDDPTEYWYIDQITNNGSVWMTTETGGEVSTYLQYVNDALLPGYRVGKFLKEQDEDEFNITPDESWNVTYLQVGDKITYDMLRDGSQDKKYFFRKNKDAYYELVDFKNGMYGVRLYNPKDGSSSRYRVVPEWFNNDTLDPKYKLDVPIDNQVDIFAEGDEDEFNVTPNEKQWNPHELKVGDTFVTSEGQLAPYKIVFIGKAGETRERFDYHNYSDDINIVLFGRSNGNNFSSGEKYLAFPISYFNDNYGSLNGYYISDFITEQDEDEFTVDAPQDWNVKDLGINSYLDSNNSGGSLNTRYKIVDFKKDSEGKELGGIIKQEKNEYSGMWYDVYQNPSYWHVDFLNRRLKPGYEVVYGYTSPEQLDEQDDEFTVDAPEEWGIADLTVGDTIKGNMWDWKKIINRINDKHRRDNHEAINREIGLWKQIYDEGVTIKSIQDFEEIPWIKFDRLITWGPSVIGINKLLSPGYQVTDNNLTESEDEFNVTPSVLWNLDLDTPINITITKESEVTDWNTDTSAISIADILIKTSVAELQDESGENYNYDEITVKNITNWINENSEVVIALFDMGGEEKESWHDVDRGFKPSSNNLDYELVDMDISVEIPESNLTESEEDFNITPNETWNTIEVGDIIEPHMWLDPKKTSRYLLVGNYGAALKLKRVLSKEDETLNPGDEDRWMYNDPNIIQVITSLFNDKLKPEYRFTGHLNESDEDFNITPSEDWNIIELGVGDTLDPTNLKMQDWSKKYIIDKIEKRHGIWDYVYLDLYKYNPKLKDWEIVKQFSNNLDSVNDTLKPGFKIQEP